MDSSATSGHGAPARWSVRLFGTFELNALPAGERMTSLGKRERALLAALALSPDCRQPRRKLTTLLWGESADETTFENLRTSVWRLRKALGDSEHRLVASEGEDVVLDAAAFEVDVLTFRRLAAQSDRSALETAATLYRGELLDGLDSDSEDFESWRRSEVARCRDQAIDVLARLMAQLSDAGETERAIEVGERILRLEPLHEAAVRRLMRLYTESGRRGAAVQLYRTLGDTLRTELDARPEAETRAVLAEISGGREPRAAVSGTAVTNPQDPSSIASPSAASFGPPPAQRHASAVGRSRQAWMGKRVWLLAGGIAAVVTIALFSQLTLWTGTTTGQSAGLGVSSLDGTIAIAVLPFANLSSDPEQEFFSDGMTDEIISALARIPSLRVVGRTSAYQFKGKNQDLRAIGQSLGVTHLIEGSVRKAGDQVRITAQLVQANDGLHVWTENYERNLTDIFAIQEEIAQAIAASLRVPLGLQPSGTLVSSRNIDPEGYQQFLHAKALVPRTGRGEEAIAILEPLLARNAGYAPAWALLALAHHRVPFNVRPNPVQWLLKAKAAAERAIQLDANLPDGYASLGAAMVLLGKLLQADEFLSKARALDPFHPDALNFSAHLLAVTGRVKEALVIREQLARMEPFVPAYNPRFAMLQWIGGDTETAIARIRSRGIFSDALGDLAQIYSAMGRYSEAADVLMAIPAGSNENYPQNVVEAAVRLLRTAPAAVAPQNLPELNYQLAFAYLYVGAPERVVPPFEEIVDAGIVPVPWIPALWHPSYAPVRKTERFKAFVSKAGFVDYWRAKGWPEFCRPVGADDFTCE